MFNLVYEFNFCSQSIECHGKTVVGIEALEVGGTTTDNCDILGLPATQQIRHINDNNPEQGIQINYSGGDQCFQMGDEDNQDNAEM